MMGESLVKSLKKSQRNMKIVAIGDIHGSQDWKKIIEKEKDADVFIFLADYLDSRTFSREEELKNLQEIIDLKIEPEKEIIRLIGNHDFHYFPEILDSSTSGYSSAFKLIVSPILDQNRNLFKICHKIDNFLFSHAGVSNDFMEEHFKNEWNLENLVDKVNDLFIYQPRELAFNGRNPYGDDVYQTPIWIRPRSLMASNKKTPIHNHFIQVVGHTRMYKIDIEGKSTGGKYYFIDCLGDSKEYLIISDGIITTGKT